jgi:hypothetical protein
MHHPLSSVEQGMDSTVWIQRSDLSYVEHLIGSILVARPDVAVGQLSDH